MDRDLRSPALASLVFAAACAALAAIHLTHGPFDADLTSTVDYLNDGSFTLALLAFAVAVQAFAATTAPSWARRAATFGPPLVAIGVIAGLVAGESPDWFAAVAVPGNLAWLAGTVRLGVWAWRTRVLPRPLAAGLGTTVLFVLPLVEIGGSAVPALVWLLLARRWLQGRPASGARARTAPVAARPADT